ncbi:MAG: DNA internalization-related competence protein ComEC/Rec2 [Methylococcaceae bacterium]|nr:DNA internalization-related competence protein ComEC/Rec2 [Methylococcaceae bacterium]
MPLLVLSFLVGIVLVQQLTQLPASNWLVLITLFISICAYKRYWHLAVCLVGIIWASLFAATHLAGQLPENQEGKDIAISGYITGLPQKDDRRTRFDFIVNPVQKDLPDKLRLNWYFSEQSVKAGQHWRFTVKLKRPHGTFNPSSFDYERWLFTQNIGATGYIRKPTPKLITEKNKKYSISIWRQTISEKLEQLLPDNDNLAIIKALSIGERSQISDSQWSLFRKTGTVHLLAISGLHIGLVAGLIFFLIRKLWAWTGITRVSSQTIAAYSALITALCYAALAGFSIPTQRALIMLAVAMFAMIYQRHLRLLTTLSWALLLVLLFDPLAVLSGGFWLSFSAVIIIVYCGSKRLGDAGRFSKWVKIHGILALGLSPLLLFFFQQVSLISPLANFMAIPLISLFVVPLILSAILLMSFLPLAATQLLTLVDEILNILFVFLNQLENLPFASLTHLQPSIWAVLLAVIAILLLLAPKGIPARSLAFVLFLPLFSPKQEILQHGEFKMALLDVGQGLASVVHTANHLLVFDSGAKYSEDFDMGKAVVLPYLQGIGASKIDRLIISHGDNDHIGGMQSLIKNIAIADIYSSVSDSIKDTPALPCLAGQQWQWDGVTFKILSPSENHFRSENNNSCVLKIESTYGSVLFTGDIEATAEHTLLRNFPNTLKSDVLIAPHHGSNTSSTTAFLQQVNPQWILIPAGYKNRFRFPHPKVLQRYQQQGGTWFSTANEGALFVHFTQKGQKVMSYRDQFGKYWNFR